MAKADMRAVIRDEYGEYVHDKKEIGKNPDGRPILVDDETKPWTLGTIIWRSINMPYPDDDKQDGERRFFFYMASLKALEPEAEFTQEEAKAILERVGIHYSNAVWGQIKMQIDPNVKALQRLKMAPRKRRAPKAAA